MTGNAFAAVGLGDGTRHELAAALDAASPGRRMPGKLVPPSNWHLTVRFLGAVDDLVVDHFVFSLSRRLDARPGTVRCSGLDAFPSLRDARVLFGIVEDADGLLATLASQAEEAAQQVGLEPEERPFRPHLTLSRLRPKRDVRALVRAFGDFSVRIPVGAIGVYRSEETHGGLRYRALERIPLA